MSVDREGTKERDGIVQYNLGWIMLLTIHAQTDTYTQHTQHHTGTNMTGQDRHVVRVRHGTAHQARTHQRRHCTCRMHSSWYSCSVNGSDGECEPVPVRVWMCDWSWPGPWRLHGIGCICSPFLQVSPLHALLSSTPTLWLWDDVLSWPAPVSHSPHSDGSPWCDE